MTAPLSPAVPSVQSREDRIGQALERLEGQLDQLTQQLGPVLAEPEPEPELSLAPAAAGRSLHGQRLDHLAAWTERLSELVNRLAARVDL